MPGILDRSCRRLVPLAGAILLLASGASVAAACDVYVRANLRGGGTRDGRSPATAFASITEAARAVDNPGDVVCVGPGTYVEGGLSPRVSGSEVAPITFRGDPTGVATGDPPGEVSIVAGSEQTAAAGAGFLLLGKRHIVIEGFTIVGFADAGIQVRSGLDAAAGNSGDIVLRDNRILDCGVGIDVSAEDEIEIERNDVIDSASTGIGVTACRGVALESPKCRAGESKRIVPRVSNNRLIYSFSHGVFVQEAAGGYVQNSVGFGNFTGISLRASSNVLVANNLLYGNGSDGVSIGADGQPCTDTRVVNNTLYRNDGWGIRVGDDGSASDGTRLLNNIVSENGDGSIAVSRPSTCRYVAGYNLVDAAGAYGPDTPVNLRYDRRGAPAFVSPSGRDGVLGWQIRNGELVDFSADDDFHLGPGSPAIDAGYSTAAALGLEGVAAAETAEDLGALDLGYHSGASAAQQLRNLTGDPFMPLFVRASGSDGQDGLTADRALASLQSASALAKAGVTVIVGPGTYGAANVGPKSYSGTVAFRADGAGALTGDPAGAVLVDPSLLPAGENKDTGFLLQRTCAVTIEGFHVRFASDSGIQIREGADGSVVRSNVVFTNTRGISVRDANEVSVVNNLVYDNDTGGIDVGGASRAGGVRLQNNTVYANIRGNGITLGSGTAATPNARVEFNIVAGNGARGVVAREAYTGRYNLFSANRDGDFGGVATRQDGDLVGMDPLLRSPEGEDGRLGGKRFADDEFTLRQAIVGDAATSPAVDAGPITAEKAGMGGGTTRIDGEADAGRVDLGFHYPARPADDLYVDPNGDDANGGRLAALPLRTIGEALRRASGGTVVHVRPGSYAEGNLRPGEGVTILGAGAGQSTVVAGAAVAFDLRQADVRLQGLDITGASDVGVRVRAARAQVVDCWIHDIAGRGVVVGEGAAALLFNNLIYRNGSTGIVVGSAMVGADTATIVHNTIVGNGGFGVTVGLDTSAPSRAAVVAANVIDANALKGVGVGAASAASLSIGHNCNRDGYRGVSQPTTDLVTQDPLFVAPSAQPLPDFRLQQVAAGQAATSPCVDIGFRTSSQLGLDESSTRTDDRSDAGLADAGYHYGFLAFDPTIVPLLRFGSLSGDCDQDGVTRVNDVVTGVNIALGAAPLASCPILDINGDMRVAINELLGAVNELLGE
ncbi:MAG: right-handed parallel beta-helix repeat-containing protein [Candidatus Binatia bacterium]